MSKPEQITAELDSQAAADLDRLAAEWGCTREQIAATALLRFLNEETRHWPSEFDVPDYVETDPLTVALEGAERAALEAFEAYIKPAEDDIAAGRLIDHDEFMREMRARYGSRDAA